MICKDTIVPKNVYYLKSLAMSTLQRPSLLTPPMYSILGGYALPLMQAQRRI